jgi:predicted nucleic acid-binding protein
MRLDAALQGVRRLFLDTAPVIYFVEDNPVYQSRVQTVFDLVDSADLIVVTSPITLAECLVYPYRLAQHEIVGVFRELLIGGQNTTFVATDEWIAEIAARLRSQHNLSLPDALQVATAIQSGCDAFLTNDAMLKRIGELRICVLDDFDV